MSARSHTSQEPAYLGHELLSLLRVGVHEVTDNCARLKHLGAVDVFDGGDLAEGLASKERGLLVLTLRDVSDSSDRSSDCTVMWT